MTRPTRWKATERAVALLLGGVRVPVTGRARGSTPDVEHPRFAIEVKDRKSLPLLLRDAMDQAEKSVRGKKVPLVVLHERGWRHENDYVVVRMGDFLELVGVERKGEAA